MRAALLAVVAVLATSGCVMTQGQRVPNLIADSQEAGIDPPPATKIVFTHAHNVEGKHYSEHDRTSRKAFEKSLQRVMQTSPILRAASLSPTEPIEYILCLDTAVNEHGMISAFVSGATLMVVPMVISSDVIVQGTLYEAATAELIGTYDAQATLNVFGWLPLLPFLPATLALAPGDEMYDDTYSDVLIQVASELSGKPRPPAIAPERVRIQEEWEGKRTITINAEN